MVNHAYRCSFSKHPSMVWIVGISVKVRDTLCSVGWPITQAVTSTLFGLMTTAFVPAYLVRVFFQTVYLVNIIGLTHALVWLPQLVAALDPCERVPLRLRLKRH
ncbi:hypothetical protein KIN20_009169 [Parelaphostrongylus tenuis]|uniref:Uncharacterized protein n=1 Tax=Parelaphostrongylus tenuis TaxID=148309 RepID=A0AAD5MNR1_PARTN|nr:hypothetical protein KIN20_009169 [Parelaphostrongylus tenuis]